MTKPIVPAGRHLDTPAALDYLESRMDAASRGRVEAHLGSPCEACHDLVRELGWLVERMRLDRVPDVTPDMLMRLFGVFEPPATRVRATPRAARFASLLFDSWSHPLPAGALRAVGQTRRLRFALGSDVLELESEIDSSKIRILRGRLRAAHPSLHRIEVEVGAERLATRPDAGGSFVFDRVPLGRALLTVIEGGNRYRIPVLE
jgi:hypothetical protein